MDFHGMKRKELQSLCKKHGILANLTNREMADRLDLVLKKDEKSLTQGPSCTEVIDVEIDSNNVMVRKGKKVRFSPENQILMYVLSESESGSDKDFNPNKKRVVKRMPAKYKVQVAETGKDAERPSRITRSNVQTTVGGRNEKMGYSSSTKKRSSRGGIENGGSAKLSRVAGGQAESKRGLITRQLRNREVVAEVGFLTKDKATDAWSRDLRKTNFTGRMTRSNTIVDKKDSPITRGSEAFVVREICQKVQLEEPSKDSSDISLGQKPATFQKGRVQNDSKAEQCVVGDQISRKYSRRQLKKTAEAATALSRDLGKTNIIRRMTRSNTVVDKNDSSITKVSEVFEVGENYQKVQLDEPSKCSNEISLGQKSVTFQKGRVQNDSKAEQCVEGDQVSRKYSRKQSKQNVEDGVSHNVMSIDCRTEIQSILPSGLLRRSRRKTTLFTTHNAVENATSLAIGPSRRSRRNITLFTSVTTAADEEMRTAETVGRLRQPIEAALERGAKVAKPIRRSDRNAMRQISEESSSIACEPVNNKSVKCFSSNVFQNETIDLTELGNSSAKGNKQPESKIQNLVVKESITTSSLSLEELPAEEFNPIGLNDSTSALHIHPPSSSPLAQGNECASDVKNDRTKKQKTIEGRDCEEDDDHRVCEEAVAPLNDIDCLVSDQLVCASGNEAIAEKTMEATLGYELSAEMPLSTVESKKGDEEWNEAEKLHITSVVDFESEQSEKDETMFKQSDQQVPGEQHDVVEEVYHDDRVCEEDVASLNSIDQLVFANESEPNANQTEEAALSSELSADMPLLSNEQKKEMDMILLGDGEWDENEKLHVSPEIDLESKHTEKIEEKDRTMFEQYDQQVFTRQHGDEECDEAKKLHITSEFNFESEHSEKDQTMFEQYDQQVPDKQHDVAEEVHHVDRVCEEDVASLNDIDCLVLDQPVCANESETLAKQIEGVIEPVNGGGRWNEAEKLLIFSKVNLGSKHSEQDEKIEKDLAKFEKSDQQMSEKQLGEHQHLFYPPVSNEGQHMHEFIRARGSFAPMHEGNITDSSKLNGYKYEAMQYVESSGPAAYNKFENVKERNAYSLNSKKKAMEAENGLPLLPLINELENNIAATNEAGYAYMSIKGSEDDIKFSLDRFDDRCLRDKEAGNPTSGDLTGKHYNCHPCNNCASDHAEAIEVTNEDSGIDMEKKDQPFEGNNQPGIKEDFSSLAANEDISCKRGGLSVENDADTSLVINQLHENRGALEEVYANKGICQDLSDISGSDNSIINTKDNQEEESVLHSVHIAINSFGTEESMEDKNIRSRNGKIDDRLTKDSKVCVHEEQAFMEVDASMLSEPVLQDPPNDNDLRDYCHDMLVDAEGSQPGECQSDHSIMSFYGSNSLTSSSNPVFKIDIKESVADLDNNEIEAQKFQELNVNWSAERVFQNPLEDHISEYRKDRKREVYESNHNDMDFSGFMSTASCFTSTCQSDYKENKCGCDDTSGRDKNENAGMQMTVEEESMPERSISPKNCKIDDQSAKYNEVWVQENQAFLEEDASMPSDPGLQDPPGDNGLRDYGDEPLSDVEGSPIKFQSNHYTTSFSRSNSLSRSFNPSFEIDFKGDDSFRIDDQSAKYNNMPGVLQDPVHDDHLIESNDDKLGEPEGPKQDVDESIHNDMEFCRSMSTVSCFSITPTFQADFNGGKCKFDDAGTRDKNETTEKQMIVEGTPENESSDQKDHDDLTYATDDLNLENNAISALFGDASLENTINSKVSNQPLCTNGSETNSSQIKEAALGSGDMPRASSDSKEVEVFDVSLVSPLKENNNSKLSVPASFDYLTLVGGNLAMVEKLQVSSKVDLENKKRKKDLDIKENLRMSRWCIPQVSEMQLGEDEHYTHPAIFEALISGEDKKSNEEKGMSTMLHEHKDQVTEMHESIMVGPVHELRTVDDVDINVNNYAAAEDAEVDSNGPANENKFEIVECKGHSMTSKRTEMESENRWWSLLPIGMLDLKDGVDIFKASTVSDTFEGAETQNKAAQTASLVEVKFGDLNKSGEVSLDLDKSEFVVSNDALAKDGEAKNKEIIEEVVNHFNEDSKEMVDGVDDYVDNKELVSNDNHIASVNAWDNNVAASDESGYKTIEEKSLHNVKHGEEFEDKSQICPSGYEDNLWDKENYTVDNSIGKAITGEDYECHPYSNSARDNAEAIEMDKEDTGVALEKLDQSFEANNVFGKMEAFSDQEVNEGVIDATNVFTVENDLENSFVPMQPHENGSVLEEVNCPVLNNISRIYNLEANNEFEKDEDISDKVNGGLIDDDRDGFSVEKDLQSSFDTNNLLRNRNLSEVHCPDLNIISSSYNTQTNTKDTQEEVVSHCLENMAISSPKSKNFIDFEGLSIPKTELCIEVSSLFHVNGPSGLETKSLENDANLPLFTAYELNMLLEDSKRENFQNSPDKTLEVDVTTETDEQVNQIVENITLVDAEQHDEHEHGTLEEDEAFKETHHASSFNHICASKGLDEKHDVSVIFQECLDCEHHKDESVLFVYSMGTSETNISTLPSSDLPTLLCGSNDLDQVGSSLIPGDLKFSATSYENEDIEEITESSKDVLEPITTIVNQHSTFTNSTIGRAVASKVEDKVYQLKLEPHQDKSEETNLLGSINEYSVLRRRNIDSLITRTPTKLYKISDMKENDLGTKREQIDTTTATKASHKRRPLGDLHKN